MTVGFDSNHHILKANIVKEKTDWNCKKTTGIAMVRLFYIQPGFADYYFAVFVHLLSSFRYRYIISCMEKLIRPMI